MLHNKILFDIYKSVKNLDKDKMDKNTEKINKLVSKLYNDYQHGGTIESNRESDNNYQEIMANLDSIETGFIGYFQSLKGYIEIYSKNAEKFEKLLNERLSIESLEKLKNSMNDLNGVLDQLK